MMYYLLPIIILILGLGLYYINQKPKETFSDMQHTICRNEGFSKEHCLKRPHPGVGLTPINQVGIIHRDSQGRFAR